jgi:hypothetical protein
MTKYYQKCFFEMTFFRVNQYVKDRLLLSVGKSQVRPVTCPLIFPVLFQQRDPGMPVAHCYLNMSGVAAFSQ